MARLLILIWEMFRIKKVVACCLLLVICSLAKGQHILPAPDKLNESMVLGKHVLILGPVQQFRIEIKKNKKFKIENTLMEGGSDRYEGKWKLSNDTLVLVSNKKVQSCGADTIRFKMVNGRLNSTSGCYAESYFRKVKKFPRLGMKYD